jgi:hypothetical protein
MKLSAERRAQQVEMILAGDKLCRQRISGGRGCIYPQRWRCSYGGTNILALCTRCLLRWTFKGGGPGAFWNLVEHLPTNSRLKPDFSVSHDRFAAWVLSYEAPPKSALIYIPESVSKYT